MYRLLNFAKNAKMLN